MKPDGGKVGNDRSALSEMARYSGHGLTLALAMGLFLALGWWLDGRLGTTPVLTIVGALVGAGAAEGLGHGRPTSVGSHQTTFRQAISQTFLEWLTSRYIWHPLL
jgi:hypothetical protein